MDAPRVIFICSGNTCRSPLAEVVAATGLAEAGVRSESAGLDAYPGCPATGESYDQAAERGLDLSRHRSRRLDDMDLDGVIWIIGMTADHVRRLRKDHPAYTGAIGLMGLPGEDMRRGGDLAGGEQVDDPYRRGTVTAYEAMGEQIDRLVVAWLSHLTKGTGE